jgi:hypothetical protein
MYARVVRFTDVSPERIEQINQRIASEGGPPPGVDSTGLKVVYDADQGTAAFVGFFETEEKMKAAAEVLEAMDPGETPGTRDSITAGEIVIDRDA